MKCVSHGHILPLRYLGSLQVSGERFLSRETYYHISVSVLDWLLTTVYFPLSISYFRLSTSYFLLKYVYFSLRAHVLEDLRPHGYAHFAKMCLLQKQHIGARLSNPPTD